MKPRFPWFGAGHVFVTVALTAFAAWVALAGSTGARVAGPSVDVRGQRLASVLRQRDELVERVATLEARLRTQPTAPKPPEDRPPTVIRRWMTPVRTTDVSGLRVCAQIVEAQGGAAGAAVILLWDICGEVHPEGETSSAHSLASLVSSDLFACWIDAVPGAGMPPCLRGLADEQPGVRTALAAPR